MLQLDGFTWSAIHNITVYVGFTSEGVLTAQFIIPLNFQGHNFTVFLVFFGQNMKEMFLCLHSSDRTGITFFLNSIITTL